MALDQPLIAYDNLLSSSTLEMRIGALDAASSFDRLSNEDLLRPAFFTSSGGVVEIGIYPPSAINCVIVGAARNDSAGQLKGVTGLTISAYTAQNFGAGGFGAGGFGGYDLIKTQDFALADTIKSRLLSFAAAGDLLVMTFTGCDPTVAIPEIFIGNALVMPFIDLGFDPYNEVGNNALFVAESGREYARQRYRRVELKPTWANILKSSWADIDTFREYAIETRMPFWFAWSPDSAPSEVYLVRHIASSAPFPIQSAQTRRFALNLQEVI